MLGVPGMGERPGSAAVSLDAVLKEGAEAPVRIDVLATSSAAPAAAPCAVPETAPKRPRGRPPKARLECVSAPAMSKRPRGRPPGEGCSAGIGGGVVRDQTQQPTVWLILWLKSRLYRPCMQAQLRAGPVRQAPAKTRRRPPRLRWPSSGHRIWCEQELLQQVTGGTCTG